MAKLPQGPARSSGWQLQPQYSLIEVIGSGAYGTVCRAKDEDINKDVAIKRMKDIFADRIDCKRILREINILARLKHPGVVEIYNVFAAPQDVDTFRELYIVMELATTDLKKLLKMDQELSMHVVNTILYNLLVGLKYIHSAGIYHRDLKPANVLVDEHCSAKICDFGLSRAVVDSEPETIPELSNDDVPVQSSAPTTSYAMRNMTKHVVTRWYRAPELILTRPDYTAKIDIWSAGCIYAELLKALPGTDFRDRGPLFPGTASFVLSPGNRPRGHSDMLDLIFDAMGTPSEEYIAELSQQPGAGPKAAEHIRKYKPREGVGLKSEVPHVDDASALDMLERLLRFDAAERIDDSEALEHELFYRSYAEHGVIRRQKGEITADKQISLEFDAERNLDEPKLREHFGQFFEQFAAMQEARKGGYASMSP